MSLEAVRKIVGKTATAVKDCIPKIKSAVVAPPVINSEIISKGVADAQKAQAMAQIGLEKQAVSDAIKKHLQVVVETGEFATKVHPKNLKTIDKTIRNFVAKVQAGIKKGPQKKMHKIGLIIKPYPNYGDEFMAKTGGQSGLIMLVDGKQIEQFYGRSIARLPLDKEMAPEKLEKVLTETLEKYYKAAKQYAKKMDRTTVVKKGIDKAKESKTFSEKVLKGIFEDHSQINPKYLVKE